MIGKYVLDKKIGRGGFGTVFRAIERRGTLPPRLLAVKIYSTDRTDRTIAKEAEVAERVHHPNILELGTVQQFCDSSGQTFRFVTMRLFPTDLSVLLDRGNAPQVQRLSILMQTASALQALHEHGYAHGDLKPANVLVTQAQDGTDSVIAQLCDFGSVYTAGDQDPDADGHTLAFSAPEVVTNKADLIGLPVDVFAFGCMYVETVCEQPLFYEKDPLLHLAQVQRVAGGAQFHASILADREYFTSTGALCFAAQRRVAHCVPWHSLTNLSKASIAFVEGCCRMNPRDRFTILDVRAYLSAEHAKALRAGAAATAAAPGAAAAAPGAAAAAPGAAAAAPDAAAAAPGAAAAATCAASCTAASAQTGQNGKRRRNKKQKRGKK